MQAKCNLAQKTSQEVCNLHEPFAILDAQNLRLKQARNPSAILDEQIAKLAAQWCSVLCIRIITILIY